jgi:hypothetical protein
MKTDRQTDRQAAICHGMGLAYAGGKKVFLLDGRRVKARRKSGKLL